MMKDSELNSSSESRNVICVQFLGTEPLPAPAMKSSVSWVMTPCSPVKVDRGFG
jgi:hypothetical protein